MAPVSPPILSPVLPALLNYHPDGSIDLPLKRA